MAVTPPHGPGGGGARYIDFVAEAPTPDGPVAISLTLVSTSPDPDRCAPPPHAPCLPTGAAGAGRGGGIRGFPRNGSVVWWPGGPV